MTLKAAAASKRDMLVAFIAADPRPVDPVRIMKGLFLFSKEAEAPERLTYNFQAYSYGPCSFDIYHDLDMLVDEGLIERQPTSARWPVYIASERGALRAEQIATSESDLAGKLREIRLQVQSLSFRALLSHVYSRYPKSAKNSIFRG